MVPIAVVVAIQIARHEDGKPGTGVSRPRRWRIDVDPADASPDFLGRRGVHADTRSRRHRCITCARTCDADLRHDRSVLHLHVGCTSALVALLPNTVAYTPFPRWFGYCTPRGRR